MVTKSVAKTSKATAVAAPKKTVVIDPKYAQAVNFYEGGLKALQERKFDKAKTAFQKVLEANIRELGDRARVHMNTCNQLTEKNELRFESAEEHYDYAVSLMNQGDYVGAREHLEKLQKNPAQRDYVTYGLAALDCLTGHLEDALRRLAEAISSNAQLRFQARNDGDFHNLAEDPRFTELLYPDPGAEMGHGGYGIEQ
jgi:tetratricopeptide (TPR) repeat protein